MIGLGKDTKLIVVGKHDKFPKVEYLGKKVKVGKDDKLVNMGKQDFSRRMITRFFFSL